MQIALNLVLNTTLLLSISIIFNQFYLRFSAQKVWSRIIGGLILGVAGIAIVTIAIRLPNSVIFDTRSILLSVSGLFYGVLPTAIAAVIIALYRVFLGGPGMFMGVAVTLSSALIGVVWRLIRKNPEKMRHIEFYLLGLLTHIVMMLCSFLLPQDVILPTVRTIALPVLLIYPLGSLVMCRIITYERRSMRTESLLSASEIRFRKVCEQAPVGILVESSDVASYVNGAYAKMLGMTREQVLRINWQTYTHPDDINKDHDQFKRLLRGEIDEYDLIKRYVRPDGEIVRVHLFVSIFNRAIPVEKSDYICIAQDITRDFEREQELLASERRHRETSRFLTTLLDSIPDHIFYKDQNGVYLGCNRAFEQASGLTRAHLIGKNDYEIYDQDTAELFVSKDAQVLRQQQDIRTEETVLFPDGRAVITETLKTPFFNDEGELAGLIGISRDITDRKKKEDKIEYLSIHDVMTGLFSRMYFDTELYRLDAANDLPYSVITGDINALKLTNDLFGHNEGDKLIMETAMLLRSSCGQGVVARTGGDEFSVLLPKIGEEEANRIVTKIYAAFEAQKALPREQNFFLSISLGYATKAREEQTIGEILKTAEEHMYRRKLLEHQSIRSTLLTTIKQLLFSKSNETMEHAERMAQLARRLGAELALSETDLVSLELMAVLHDIGKIGISNDVLSKPGPLEELEWTEIRRHPEIGYRIALTIPELQGIAGYILCHHERWDGTGYPQGLGGEEIPYIARIISVIDAYDAMTEDRSYRSGLPVQQAADEIIRYAGRQFDPEVARVFIERVLELPFRLPE
ncbi:MAG TPA: HD domain-containing phosphohydrolase [Clostridia bacterium]|nr:HD domain-containing phosphohydrolase [Clostridia bacterium]